MVLGRVSEQQKDLVVEAEVDGEVMEVEVPEFPKSFRWVGGFMVREMEDKDDILHQFQFARTLFYPLHRIRKEDGTFCLGMRVHLPTGKTRDFTIDTSLLASPQKLSEQLCDYEVATTNNKDSSLHMTAYLKDYLFKLMNEAEELNTLTTFGWHYDNQAFLVGDRLYHRDGTVRKVLVGGYRLKEKGNFYAPTILADIPLGAPPYQEEFFGPVASVFRVKNLTEAIALANSTNFGLGASFWSNDQQEIETAIEQIEAGAVFVNGMVKSDPRVPFGGIKRSGFGRELGLEGIREFVNIKTIWIK
jgi:hypothetical protein